ncbi:GDSL-type esterase/lipase family protein [Actinokineospora sp. PR83]|uniref:GDSL-type esterase/lipase family protein n=1 Tax=Actinokineospora sp. PR83 TaxID=2884908 RepID=UPI001F272B0F|nr:GDSL-type esterase/lipase family protein [Actinokineospora sp. PR83]MCG8917167.1 GDSL-type esterase/lipase family protein [Actinokineospora sp. PR83]
MRSAFMTGLRVGPWKGGAVVAGVALVAGLAAAPQAQAAPPQAPAAVVTLGDSFISGEAGRWSGNSNDSGQGDFSGTDRAWAPGGADPHRVYGTSADNGCHRSDVAEVHSAAIANATAVNISCSGAKTTNVLTGGTAFKGENPQNEQLAQVARSHRVKVVVVSIGGNDLDLAGVAEQCGRDFMLSTVFVTYKCQSSQSQVVQSRMAALTTSIPAVLDDVRTTMRAAGYADTDYRLVLQGYAHPVPASGDYRYAESGYTRYQVGGCPFWNSDSDWLRSVNDQLASVLSAAATAEGADFLDLRGATAGHEVCNKNSALVTPGTPPSPAANEWVRFTDVTIVPGRNTQGDTQESLHPNAYGQRAQGRCLALLAARGSGKYSCTAQPGAGIEGVTLAANANL